MRAKVKCITNIIYLAAEGERKKALSIKKREASTTSVAAPTEVPIAAMKIKERLKSKVSTTSISDLH